MPIIEPQADDDLRDFERAPFTAAGFTRDVWRKGTGPAVVVVHEVPGITPRVAAFARMIVDRGMSVALPSLLGTPGRAPSVGYVLSSVARLCVRRELSLFAVGATSPIVAFLRALAAAEHARAGGPGVGAIGMCFSGGYALGMMVDDRVIAPVLSQPSAPSGLLRATRRDLGLDAADLERVRERARAGQEVIGLRFTGDVLAPAERFDRLREELGASFCAREIDSSPGNEGRYPRHAHSVLTEHLGAPDARPTHEALALVLDFFARELLGEAAPARAAQGSTGRA